MVHAAAPLFETALPQGGPLYLQLKRWIEETPAPPDPDRNPLLLKVFFGEVASQEDLVEHIRQRRLEAEALRSYLEEIEEDDLHARLTISWGLEYAGAVIRWAKQVERELSGSGR